MSESARSLWGNKAVVNWQEPAGLTQAGRHAAAAGIVALIFVAFTAVGFLINPDGELILALAIPLVLMAFALTAGASETLYCREPVAVELSLDAIGLRLTKSGLAKPEIVELAANDVGQLVLRYLPTDKPLPLRLELHHANKRLALAIDERMVPDPNQPDSDIPLAALIGSWWPKPDQRRQRAVGFFWAGPSGPWQAPIPAVFAARLAQDPLRLRLRQPTMRMAIILTIVAAFTVVLPETRVLSAALLTIAIGFLAIAHQLVRSGRLFS